MDGNNPGKTITIYDVPSIVREAWPRAAVPTNIMKGFQAAGIYHYNPQIFSEDDFAPSYVTNRPDPTQEVTATSSNLTEEVTASGVIDTYRADETLNETVESTALIQEIAAASAVDTDKADQVLGTTVTNAGDTDCSALI